LEEGKRGWRSGDDKTQKGEKRESKVENERRKRNQKKREERRGKKEVRMREEGEERQPLGSKGNKGGTDMARQWFTSGMGVGRVIGDSWAKMDG